jgi:hypothetical protein
MYSKTNAECHQSTSHCGPKSCTENVNIKLTKRSYMWYIYIYIYIYTHTHKEMWRVRSSIPCIHIQVTPRNTEEIQNKDFQIMQIGVLHVYDCIQNHCWRTYLSAQLVLSEVSLITSRTAMRFQRQLHRKVFHVCRLLRIQRRAYSHLLVST